jgi:hypothetical protein
MLNSHPEISWLNEFEYAVDTIVGIDGWPDIDNYAEYLSTDRIFQATEFTVDRTKDYPDLIKSFLVQKKNRDKKNIIGATCHRHYDKLLRMFPQARFIYLLRDPRDVSLSNIGMGWAGNVWKGVDRWIEAELLWEKTKKQIQTIDYIEIKYEELITSPEEQLATICSFLNVEYSSKMMSYPEHTTYAKPNPKLTEQWKRKMSEKEIALVEFKIHTLIRKRGYVPHFATISQPNRLSLLFLNVQNKLFRQFFRIKQYGFWLTVGDYLTRKLRLKSLERRNKLIFNKRTKKYLK